MRAHSLCIKLEQKGIKNFWTSICRHAGRSVGVAIVSCNDGLRPVIMKLEATDEESKIDYEPVEMEQ